MVTAMRKVIYTYQTEELMEPVVKITLDEYQHMAQRTSRKDMNKYSHMMNAMLGLAGEAGECCDLVKKRFYQDNREIKDELIDELGDVMWYVAEGAAALGVTLNEIAIHNINKLMKRYPDGFDADKSLHREEYLKRESDV